MDIFGTNPQNLSALGRPTGEGGTAGLKPLPGGFPYAPAAMLRQQGLRPVPGVGILREQRIQQIGGIYHFSQHIQNIASHLKKSIHIGVIETENTDGTYKVRIKTSLSYGGGGGSETYLHAVAAQFSNQKFSPGDYVIVIFFDGNKHKPTIQGHAGFKNFGTTVVEVAVNFEVV